MNMYSATALGRERVASPPIARFYTRGKPLYSFYRRLSGPQDHSGHEEAKTNLHPSDTRDRPPPPPSLS